MKRLLLSLGVAAVGVAAWYFLLREPNVEATEGFLTNINKSGVVIEGYDPVAYFTDNRPVKGTAQFSEHFQGGTYWFASRQHADLFRQSPQKYAPQYGAFCGYAVSIGKLRPVDPTIFQIENGRLILQHTKEAYDLFNKDLQQSVNKADATWPTLVTSHVGKPLQYDNPAGKPVAAK